MAFPEKTKWFKRPIGWEDLGEMDKTSHVENGETIRTWKSHVLCNRTANVGREDGEGFLFCPRCLVKLDQPTD